MYAGRYLACPGSSFEAAVTRADGQPQPGWGWMLWVPNYEYILWWMKLGRVDNNFASQARLGRENWGRLVPRKNTYA